MHELSIAIAILQLAGSKVPPDCALTGVHIVAGPMRAIEPDAMAFAWEALLADTGMSGVLLDLETKPWTLHCPSCGARWTTSDIESVCACGRAGGRRSCVGPPPPCPTAPPPR